MAEKIIDGNYKENIYYLLCNLANLDNKSIVLAAINKEIEAAKLEKEKTDKVIEEVSGKLELAKEQKDALNRGPGAFSSFVNSFNNNKVLVDYLGVLGYEDCLKDFIGSHEKEQESNNLKAKNEREISSLTDRLQKLEADDLKLEERLKSDYKTLNNINNATADAKILIEASVSGNGSFNRDFVEQTFVPFENLAKSFNIVFPDKFVEQSSKAIFFPQDGFDNVVEEYREGKYKEILYANNSSEKIDMDSISEDEVIKEVPINTVDSEVEPDINKDLSILGDEEVDDVVPIEVDVETNGEVTDEVSEGLSEEETNEMVSEAIDEIDDEVPEISLDIEEDVGEETTNAADRIIEEMSDEVANLGIVIDGSKNEFGLDDSKISEELKHLMNNADSQLIENNVQTLKALNVEDNAFYYVNGEYSYLTDKDLASKLNFLRAKDVPEKTLAYAIKAHYLDVSIETIKEAINDLENSDIGLDKRYIAVIKYGVDNFFNALEELRDNGIEPDDSETASYLSILTKYSNNIAPDTEVLKDYGISLLRKNGKYELGLYLKNPRELVQSLDDIIEMGEESLISNTPEVLAMNTDTIVQRLLYVKANGVDYKEGEVYADYIYKPNLFNREFGDPELEKISSREDCNVALDKTLNNDLCSIFIEVLDKFYMDERSYKAVELSEDEKGVFEELKATLEKEFEAKLINKNTYEMNDVIISRNKFERNLSCLVSALLSNGEDLLSEAREVLTVAALYNSRRAEGKIISMPQKVEEETASRGGIAA